MAYLLLFLYCSFGLVASIFGGALPLIVRMTHARMQLAISFVAGVMLGVGVLSLLPHAFRSIGNPHETAVWLLAGFLVMFLLQRFLHVHHHVAPGDDDEHAHHHAHQFHPTHDGAHGHAAAPAPGRPAGSPAPGEALAAAHLHVHGLGGDEACEQFDPLPASGMLAAEKFSWTGAATGLTLHTVLGGVALAASVEIQVREGYGWLAGLGAFAALVLHKPFDALTIATLMTAGGWSRRDCHFVNVLFALSMPLGVLLFYLGFMGLGGQEAFVVGRVLALSAGTFVCIAASDLLPEMQFHSHDRVKLTTALLSGVAFALVLEYLPH